MNFTEDARRFLLLGVERIVALAGLLAARSVPYTVVRTGEARHLMVRFGRGRPRLILVAHYDRVRGSPGVLDNSCACLQLVELAARIIATGRERGRAPNLLFAFTDGEEAAVSGAAEQGSFALAKVLRAALGRAQGPAPVRAPERATLPPVLVFDVTGRGRTLLLSSAPQDLLERNGMGASALAARQTALVDLARRAAIRAGLPPPINLAVPWSDDLGLILGAVPALTLSLLPAAEAETLAKAQVGAGKRGLTRDEAGPAWPETWSFLHSSDDGPELAEEGSFALMSAFLDAVAAEASEELMRSREGKSE